MAWGAEDGGPARRQVAPGGLGLRPGEGVATTFRLAPAATMVVAGAERDLFLLRHTAGDDAIAIVERLDPVSLEPLAASAELPGGPTWPGGLAVHPADGAVHVVFGNHAHRLDGDLRVTASAELPRRRPYNSFVTLPDGHLVMKDFGREPCELVVLHPVSLAIVDRLPVPEPSIARLSADGNTVYVVGDTSLLRATWDGARLRLDDPFRAVYRTMDGQTFGWDCVLTPTHAWFLDDGEGTEGFPQHGTLRGIGVSSAPLHLVRVDLSTAEVALTEICGRPGGIIANPPVIDDARNLAVGYDSGNGVLSAFDATTLEPRWRRDQDHASHLILYADTGELVTGDGTDVVVLDVATGTELARASSGSPMQSVLFPCPGFDRDFYVCSFPGVTRTAVTSP